MRDILFKAKRTDNGEWVEGLISHPHCTDTEKGIQSYFFNEVKNGVWYLRIVSAETICQYTGLKDKNGNKIWENDVVKRYNSNGDVWRISKIVWAEDSLNMGWCIEDIKSLTKCSDRLFKVGFDVNDTKKFEVIGNIFDNPELVKE